MSTTDYGTTRRTATTLPPKAICTSRRCRSSPAATCKRPSSAVTLGTPKPGGQVEYRFDFEALNKGQVECKFNLTGPDKKIVKTDKFDFVVT
jgi:hypothetical protein